MTCQKKFVFGAPSSYYNSNNKNNRKNAGKIKINGGLSFAIRDRKLI